MTPAIVSRVGLIVGTTAAVLALGPRNRPVWSPLSSTERDRPEQALMGALANVSTRLVDGRLAGSDVHAPAPRGTPAGEHHVAPEMGLAAARFVKARGESDAPADRRTLGVAYLALGEWDQAVDALEDAVRRDPGRPGIVIDLSASYLARASADDRPEDWVNALAAANRAIRLDPRRPEAYFNRALAFHGLHLRAEEVEGWNTYRSVERSHRWLAEAIERQRSAVVRPEVPADSATAPDPQRLRERIEDELLTQWGTAAEHAHFATADRLLAEASRLADRLAAAGGDAMPGDEIARIRRAGTTGDSSLMRHLAIGHRLYGAARGRFLQEELNEASDLMSRASVHLRAAGSPYWQQAPIVRAFLLYNRGQHGAALEALGRLPTDLPPRYFHLRGRAAWMGSLIRAGTGRYDMARDLLAHAVDAFRSSGEHDNLIATETNLAEAEWFLGDARRAWAKLVAVFADIERVGSTRRNAHLDLAATVSLAGQLPEAALEFHNALIRRVATAAPSLRADAYVRRARTLVRSGDARAAAGDLARASTELSLVKDAAVTRRMALEIHIAQAERLSHDDCGQAMGHIDAALRILTPSAGTIRRGALLTTRARCRESAGDVAGAKADLLEAVRLFEARRATIASAADRLQAFERERVAFKQLIAIEALQLGDEDAALRMAERARSGGLLDAWGGGPVDLADHRALPEDVAVIYYESLADRVLIWVLTRERRVAMTSMIGEDAAARAVDRILRAIRLGADLVALRPPSADLFDGLIAPALHATDAEAERAGVTPKSTIVFVPDGALFALPFGALPDARGRPLIDRRRVALAPSLRSFLAASTRLASFTPSEVLAVGDGHDPVSTGLPRLPRADGEASEVGRLYPRSVVLTGADATKRRVMSTRARVMHFSGHSVLNERDPQVSRLLFAPEAGVDETGWLLQTEISPERFGGTGVVVLATCEGAAGRPVLGEGAISLGRAFFAAGVPAVVASLWPVDDDLQTLTRTLHRTLQSGRDAAQALRAGQLAILAERGAATPVRVWGGFIMLGGVL